MRELVAAFVLGLLVRDVSRFVWGRFVMWKMERDYVAAQKRIIGCSHAHYIIVDTGVGPTTKKCTKCWALQFEYDTDKWHPNSCSPDRYAAPRAL